MADSARSWGPDMGYLIDSNSGTVTPYAKVAVGGSGTVTPVSPANPLPVAGTVSASVNVGSVVVSSGTVNVAGTTLVAGTVGVSGTVPISHGRA